jgi:uncharacterized protein with GYD domain
MPTFVTLARYTPEGAKTIAGSRDRYRKFEMAVREAGGRVVAAFGLLGSYDLLLITELPDEKVAIKLLMTAVSGGTVTTETLTAVPMDEFYDLTAGVPGHA